jgi:hypothetical protein
MINPKYAHINLNAFFAFELESSLVACQINFVKSGYEERGVFLRFLVDLRLGLVSFLTVRLDFIVSPVKSKDFFLVLYSWRWSWWSGHTNLTVFSVGEIEGLLVW